MEVPSIFLNRVLVEAAKKNASSLHLTIGNFPLMRIDGQLAAVEGESIVTVDAINKIINSFTDEEERQELKERKEIILVKVFAGGFRFRVNIFYQKDLLSLSFHHIPETVKSLSELRLPPVLSGVVKLNSGLFVIAGAYGSNKTMTAAALIEEVNRNYRRRVITIEDPIENLFVNKKSLIEQRQVGRDVKSVIDGLYYCLEEDVDLIYVGKIRKDFKSAIPLILELAAGNSLVILEIDIDSSVRVIEKIFNSLGETTSVEAARYNLADVLFGVITQKLIPRIGGGMVMAAEVLLANPAVKSLIREGKIYQLESIMQTSRKEGMISMVKSLEELIKTGEIKQENAGLPPNF
ncbi:Flp pilus assembly complex ATPase component TadA [Candidatus Falkowbacteria bacterium]|nr:Flp pilus assembly complex ATPase component TadA [Candidatus Falkowbacteria bacterium]